MQDPVRLHALTQRASGRAIPWPGKDSDVLWLSLSTRHCAGYCCSTYGPRLRV